MQSNFYLNDMVLYIKKHAHQAPILAGRKVLVLLYADDAVLLSRSGLWKTINAFTEDCKKREGLKLNYIKSKIMVFNQEAKP